MHSIVVLVCVIAIIFTLFFTWFEDEYEDNIFKCEIDYETMKNIERLVDEEKWN